MAMLTSMLLKFTRCCYNLMKIIVPAVNSKLCTILLILAVVALAIAILGLSKTFLKVAFTLLVICGIMYYFGGFIITIILVILVIVIIIIIIKLICKAIGKIFKRT